MIVAGEASGDLHAAHLIRALRAQLQPGTIYIFGLGSTAMAEAGARLLFDARELAAIGPVDALPKLRRYLQCLQGLVRAAQASRPELVVLVDFPEFNLRLAKRLKALGLYIVYYISPQIWAWRKRRIRIIRKYVDKMLVILPFEKDFYYAQGVDVHYVGHPLVHSGSFHCDPVAFRREVGILPDRRLVALLPGSRPQEIRHILPVLLQATATLSAKIPITFLLAGAEGVAADVYADLLSRFRAASPGHAPVDIRLLTGRARELLAVSDLAIVKSGTVTLEALLAAVPFLVVYRISWLSWFIGQLLIDTPYYGLANLIAGRRVVPELLQRDATPERIAEYAQRWLDDPAEAARVRRELQLVKEKLGSSDASQEAARIILDRFRSSPAQPAPV